MSDALGGGHFVVSLDFELYWGVRDKRALAEYRQQLEGARRAVPALLRVFEQFGVRATWATVGLIFCSDSEDARRHLPAALPAYDDRNLSPYTDQHRWQPESHYRFAPELVERIAQAPGQEIATHTFSHYYCLEQGQNEATFEADLTAARLVAARRSVELRSIVFPRNQVNPAYLPACRRAGIRSYRGALQHHIYEPRQNDQQGPLLRAQRFLDGYLSLSGERSYPLSALGDRAPFNVAASAFLRPHAPALSLLDARRAQRLCSELTHAARRGHVFHLWWHPHNFGHNLHENLAFLCRVLAHFAGLNARYGMQSLTMNELASLREGQVARLAA